MPVQESWLVVHVFCPTSSSHSLELARATSLCPSAVGQKDGRWLWWGGGDSVSTCSAGPTLLHSSLCFGKETQKHTICWQQSVPGSPQALAGSWLLGLESWRPSWEWRLLQTQQQPGPGPCPAQPPAQGGDRAGLLRKEPFPASPLTKQPRKIQVPGEESYAKGSNGHSRKNCRMLESFEGSLPSFFTQDMAVFSDVTN